MTPHQSGRIADHAQWCLYLLTAMLAMFPVPGSAYVGPGAGLGMIGSLIAVIIAVLVAIAGLVIFPFRLLMKRRNRSSGEGDVADVQSDRDGES